MLKLRVASKTQLTDQIVGLKLESGDGSALPGFGGGAHLNLHLGKGLSRQYSLCNPSESPAAYELAVLIESESRGGSKAVAALAVGDLVESDEPQNHFGLKTASNHPSHRHRSRRPVNCASGQSPPANPSHSTPMV